MCQSNKKFVEKVFIVVLFVLIIYSGSELWQKAQAPIDYTQGKVQTYRRLVNQQWPKDLLSPEIASIKQKKIIYFYSQHDCEQCTISHLQMLKTLNANLQVQILGNGEHLAFMYKKYEKILELNFPFIEDKLGFFSQSYPDVELPLLAVLDGNNKAITAWKAEVEKIPYSKAIIEKYFQP